MNEHIIEYLDYYIKLDNPQYAVMLIGNWGCGKTYFIKDLIDKWDESTEDNDKITLKPIYISLNGINDTNKINDKIRAAISPILYSKGMQVAKTIFKGLLKSTAKIDLNFNEDDKSDGNISFDVDTLGIFNTSNESVKGKKILVFDDVERCKINTDEIFGYINNFVEHNKCKVILLTDEKKIESKYRNSDNSNDVDYKEFKEKLIGQTFEVKSDINTAVTHFINESKKINSNLNLDRYRELIIELYNTSKLENLRVLKQSLLDFNRLTNFIKEEFKKHEYFSEFIKNLLAYFIIVYAEYRTGNEDMINFQEFNYFNDKEDTPSKIAERKYNPILNKFNIYHSSSVMQIEYLLNYIKKGFISKDALNDILSSNTFFREDKEQDWEKLWWWSIMEDKKFKELRDKVWKQFSKGNITETTVLLHISGIFITLINENLIDKNKSYVVRRSKQIISRVFRNNPNYLAKNMTNDIINASWGKQYQSFDTPEFKQIKAFLDEKIKEAQSESIAKYMKNLFEEITEGSIYELNEKLRKPLPDNSNSYERTPIFNNVDGKKLGRRLKSFSNKSIMDFKAFIIRRYYPEKIYVDGSLENYHKLDLQCLTDLRTELARNMKSREIIKNKALREFISYLDEIIEKLHNF